MEEPEEIEEHHEPNPKNLPAVKIAQDEQMDNPDAAEQEDQ